ncbi:MAG TPA: hypothetical protein ENI29_12430, partial [bacterium]|nr:hypothetical protein [bacterium]
MSETKLKVGLESQELVMPNGQNKGSRISLMSQRLKYISKNVRSLVSISLLVSLLGFIVAYLFATASLISHSLPVGLIFAFILLEILLFLFIMIFSTKNLRFTKFRLMFMIGGPMVSLLLVSLLHSNDSLELASQIPIITLPLTLLITRLYRIIKRDSLKADYGFSFSKTYHQHKVFGLWVSLIVLFFVFSFIFYTEPQHLSSSAFFVIIFTLIFTKKEKGTTNNGRDRHLRSVTLVSIFLILMTTIFAVGSIVNVNTPAFQFATVSQSSRIEGSNIDFSNLEYYNSFDGINPLSINDQFIVMCEVSPGFGEAALIRVRLVPENVPKIEGYQVKSSYEITSNYLNGPINNRQFFAQISLNKLDLLPGIYKVYISYDIRSGFSYRSSAPREYFLTVVKDDLKIISTEPFDFMPSSLYGSVYTVENKDDNYWTVSFDGRVVNSLNEPVSVKGLELYLEGKNGYENLTTLDTNKDGSFFYSIQINGSFALLTMAKVEVASSDLYNSLVHEEMAGLEREVNGHRFLPDLDGDGYPDWDFTLYDLMLALAEYYPDYLDFFAEFNESSGSSTFDSIRDREGLLQGNTAWSDGIRDFSLLFDGTGDIIPGSPTEAFGSFIYATYGTISYDYMGGGGNSDSTKTPTTSLNIDRDLGSSSTELTRSPTSTTSVNRGGVDWTSLINSQSQSNTYTSADLTTSGGGNVPIIESWTEQFDPNPSTSIILNKPSGVVSGDLLLLIVMNDDRSSTA